MAPVELRDYKQYAIVKYMNILPEYLQEYNTFMTTYRITEVSPEEIGKLVARMAWHYSTYNMKYLSSLNEYNKVISKCHNQSDMSGKMISAAKADAVAAATPEAAIYEEGKIHVANIEQFINALKALQKGVLHEYSTAH